MGSIVYAIIRADAPGAHAMLGLQKARAIRYGDLAAIVSTVPDQKWSPEEHIAIGVGSRTVVETDEEAIEILRSAYDVLAAVLLKMVNEVCYELKVYWGHGPSAASISPVESEVLARAAVYHRPIREALSGASLKCRTQQRFGNDMISRLAFNVRRGSEGAFRAEVDRLTERYPELTLSLTGPWPPFD